MKAPDRGWMPCSMTTTLNSVKLSDTDTEFVNADKALELMGEMADALETSRAWSMGNFGVSDDEIIKNSRKANAVLAKFEAFKEGNAESESGDRQTIPDIPVYKYQCGSCKEGCSLICENSGKPFQCPLSTKETRTANWEIHTGNPDTDNAGGDDEGL